MKAIQVKVMPANDKRGSQYKAFIKGSSVVVPSWKYNNDIEQENVEQVARLLMDKLDWSENSTINGCGCLPNGDWVITIESINKSEIQSLEVRIKATVLMIIALELNSVSSIDKSINLIAELFDNNRYDVCKKAIDLLDAEILNLLEL